MPEDQKPQSDSTSSSSSGSGGATGGSDNANPAAEAAAPIENMTNAAPVTPMDTGGTGGDSDGQQAEEGRGRSLTEKSQQLSVEKTPEELRQENIQRKIDAAVVYYGLNREETHNLEVSVLQPGIEVTSDFVKKQVQAIAPDKLVIAECREKFGASMAHVAEAGLSYLAPPAANMAKQQSQAAAPSFNA